MSGVGLPINKKGRPASKVARPYLTTGRRLMAHLFAKPPTLAVHEQWRQRIGSGSDGWDGVSSLY
ncbi:hypothetical protein CHELA40_10667 [Chelatococcus asaccharovorans]|nr:hypothetical protein CHELA40_10667 [Chelatococcus asaccharovorans]CAH1686307.1 hypothetical protein CHELA17_64941 [Chelatococcus asaccharovorans]